MTKVFVRTNYNPQNTDILFFDANIWFYLFATIGNYKQQYVNKYSNFFAKAIKNQSKILVSSHIISEFFNRYLRTEFKKLQNKNSNRYNDFKKDFKPTRRHKDSMNFIKNVVQDKILKYANTINDNFDVLDLTKLFYNLENHDFNDKYYAELAKYKNFKIVTNDKDFKIFGNDITIMTAV